MKDAATANLLAIEASSPVLGLALSFGGDRLVHSEIETGQSLGQMIFRRIDALMQSSGLVIGRIDGIVVGTGPGSFTGLRIAIAAAKGIACASKIPVVGVSLFELAAYSLRHEPTAIEVCTSVRKGELLIAEVKGGTYAVDDVRVESHTEYERRESPLPYACLHCAPGCCEGIVGRRDLTGNIDLTASTLLALGREKFIDENIPDLHLLEPLYIQPSQAEINHERRVR